MPPRCSPGWAATANAHAVEPSRGLTDAVGRVALVDATDLLGRRSVAAPFEPLRRPRPPPRRVDDEVGGEQGGRAAVAVLHDHAHHPGVVAREGQVEHGGVLAQGHRRAGSDALPHVPLQERAADQQRRQPALAAGQRSWREAPDALEADVAEASAASRQVGGQAGEHLLQDRPALGQQAVGVPTLRDAAPRLGPRGDVVPVHDRDPLVVVEQRPGREQTGHARAHHDGVRAHRHHPAGARMAPTRPGTWSSETVVNVVGSEPVSRANVALPASGLGQ